jgi:plasmid stability protein
MTLTIKLPDADVQALKARAAARGVSAEQYALEVLEHDLAAADNPSPAPKRFNNLSDLLLSSPFAGAGLDLERSKDRPRPVDLG